jgi:Intraflagellar transport complex B protein 46 C terminal
MSSPNAQGGASTPGGDRTAASTTGVPTPGRPNAVFEADAVFPGGYDASKYSNLCVDPALAELFNYIGRYKPEKRQLACELKPFIPDYIAAVGDVDEFLKPARPDGQPEMLGLKVLDEPSINQSDPAIMRKFLRANMKGTAAIEDNDEAAIQHGDEDRDAKIDQWIKDVEKLRDSEVTGEVYILEEHLHDHQCLCFMVQLPCVHLTHTRHQQADLLCTISRASVLTNCSVLAVQAKRPLPAD